MRRGSTMQYTMTFDLEPAEFAAGVVTFCQEGKIKMEKLLTETALEGRKLTFTLSGEETLSFTAGKRVMIQLRVLMEDGRTAASEIFITGVEEMNKEEIKEEGTL